LNASYGDKDDYIEVEYNVTCPQVLAH